MTVSIALCTYNGQRFLEQQLRSYLAQTVLPDEIVVCDDGSSDGTLEILKDWAGRYPSIDWRISRNPQKLGAPKNFEKAISQCTGDLIFLSDQDDVWRSDKVERIRRFFQEHAGYEAVFTDAGLIDDIGVAQPGTLMDHSFLTAAARKKHGQEELLTWSLLLGNVMTGATMALRHSALGSVLPFHLQFRRKLWHDGWIGFALLAKGAIGYLDEALMEYRIHGEQQVGLAAYHDPFEALVVENKWDDPKVSIKTRFENFLTAVLFLRGLQKVLALPEPVTTTIEEQYHKNKRAYFRAQSLPAKKVRLLKWFVLGGNDISFGDLLFL